MINRQLEHHEIKNERKKFNIEVVCDNLSSPENIGLIFRICEAMGVSKINICGDSPPVSNPKLFRTSRSTIDKVKFEYFKSTYDCISALRERNYKLVALEITTTSKPIRNIKFALYSHVALIIGSEKNGIEPSVLQSTDMSVHIPMYGLNTSINVTHSLAIALYEITNQQINNKDI